MAKGSGEAPNAVQSVVFPIRASDIINAHVQKEVETQTGKTPTTVITKKGQ